MARVLVTGASGFIGSALVGALARAGVPVRAAYRTTLTQSPVVDTALVGDLSANTRWERALEGVDAVVHLAGPADGRPGARALGSEIVDASGALARQAASVGVTRLVYVSSIKATRGRTTGEAVSEDAAPEPADDYGRAKLAAEQAFIAQLGERAVALRPPLVVASNAKGKFGQLLALAASGVLLPFAGIANRRSLIALDSLVAAIMAVLARPDGGAGIFHTADHPALSTPDMIAALRQGMSQRANLFSAPTALLPSALTQSLEVDDTRFRAAYGADWSRDARADLVACGAAYRARAR